MDIKLSSILTWSIGSNAKAKYFAQQNKDNIYYALLEIVLSNQFKSVASFTTFINCNDNPELNGTYCVSLYFNDSGDTFFKLVPKEDSEKFRAVTQDLFEAIVATRKFKQFTQKATKNIQDCFKDVITPLYREEFRISYDELDLDRDLDRNKTLQEDVRKAINNLMKLKGKIVSSSTLNLSHPELENK